MKPGKRKILILSLLFATCCVIGMLSGKEAGVTESRGSTVQAASLPVMCFSYGDRLINPLKACLDGGSRGFDHQTVYPFTNDDLSLKVHLLDGTEVPASVSYELRSEQDGRLMARGNVTSFENDRSDRSFTIRFQDILTEDEYYHLSWKVSFSRREVSYHTRVIKLSDPKTLTMLADYGAAMHKDLFQRETARPYAAKLETDTQTDKDTLAYVNIRGNFDQLSWGNSGARLSSDSYMTIEAVQTNYLYLHFDFLVEAELGEDLPAQFRVKESMTLQRDANAVYILSYERHMEQLWSFQENSVTDGGFLLGVQETDRLERRSSEDEKFTAFTVAGELFCYDENEQRLTRIFSFREAGEHVLRTLENSCLIRIMEVGSDGRVEFAVCGYMNGGTREGSCGISYCIYDSKEKQVTEKMFLRSDRPAEELIREVEQLFVKGNDHFLYFVFDEQLLVMDISTGETAVLVSRAEYPGLTVNEAGTAFAWSSGTDQTMPAALRVVDLKAGSSRTIPAEDGEFLKPLGYLREDLIIGYGHKDTEAVSDGQGARVPFSRFRILGEDLETLYEYAFEGIYIDHLEIGSEKVIIHRFRRQSGRYGYLDADVMLRSDGDTPPSAAFSAYTHETLKKMAVLSYGKLPSSLRIEQESVRLFAAGSELTLPSAGEAPASQRHYYAYGKGQLRGVYAAPGEAIAACIQDYGYVMDENSSVVWCWCPRLEAKQLAPGTEAAADREKARDLTGASLRALLYYLNNDIPVLWSSPDLGIRWLMGYEWQNVVLYDPGTGWTYRMRQTVFESNLERDNNYLWYFEQ